MVHFPRGGYFLPEGGSQGGKISTREYHPLVQYHPVEKGMRSRVFDDSLTVLRTGTLQVHDSIAWGSGNGTRSLL